MQIVLTGLWPRNKPAQQRAIYKRIWHKPKLSFNWAVKDAYYQNKLFTLAAHNFYGNSLDFVYFEKCMKVLLKKKVCVCVCVCVDIHVGGSSEA